MRRFTFYLLWLFVFSLAWERVELPLIGRVTNLLGLGFIASAALTTSMQGRFRRPGVILWLAICFAVSAFLSLFWTDSTAATLERARTYVQLVGVVWAVGEFARTSEERQSLLVAFCLGMLVPMTTLLNNFVAGVQIAEYEARFSGGSYNADELGLMCALLIPISWRLMLNGRGAVRFVASTCFLLAPVGMLLTGTRGAFLTSMVGFSIIPLTMPRLSRRAGVLVTCVLALAVAVAVKVVPSASWARILTIDEQISQKDLGGRWGIWTAGWQAFEEQPVLGVGAAGFEAAVHPIIGEYAPPHNTILAVLVEQGIVGFLVFVGLLAACASTIWKLAPPQRKFWGVLMLSWLVGVMSVHWQYNKLTWLLFGLLGAEATRQAARLKERQNENGDETLHEAGPEPRRTRGRLRPVAAALRNQST